MPAYFLASFLLKLHEWHIQALGSYSALCGVFLPLPFSSVLQLLQE